MIKNGVPRVVAVCLVFAGMGFMGKGELRVVVVDVLFLVSLTSSERGTSILRTAGIYPTSFNLPDGTLECWGVSRFVKRFRWMGKGGGTELTTCVLCVVHTQSTLVPINRRLFWKRIP